MASTDTLDSTSETTVAGTLDSPAVVAKRVEDAAGKELSTFIRSPFYESWREKTQATGGCANPIHLSGEYKVVRKGTGELLHDHSGSTMVPCGTRRADQCAPCADRYAADAFHLIRAGLDGDESKGVDKSVSTAPRLFVTLTAPGFGAVHTRRLSKLGRVKPCTCGDKHHADDPRLSGAIDVDTYDYEAAVLWQAHAGVLWHRWATAVRRKLANAGGLTVKEARNHLIVSYSKVAEYQRRGLVHFHAVVRVDGPEGPSSTAPAWATPELLANVVRDATAAVTVDTHRPTGEPLILAWGTQVEPKPIQERGDGSSGSIAGYIAKYATKSSGVTASGVDRRIRSCDHITSLRISEHHRRMMLTAWDLGGLDAYEDLNLRRWTHMLGFRGHFLTKSKVYSTTFKQLRLARQLHRFTELLTELEVSEDEVTVVNDWDMTRVGHANDAQAELAAAIANTFLSNRDNIVEVN